MQVRCQLSERAKQRLGHAAVFTALVLAFLATGCGIPDERPEERDTTARSPGIGELRPVVHVPEPEPVAPAVRTAPVTFDEAEGAYRARRYDEAVELFTAYNERKPENPWGLYMLGLSAWKAGNHGLAELAFTEALTRDPRHVKSLVNLSRVLLETGRPEEALGEIEFALEIDSTASDALRLRARALYELDRPDDAAEAYRYALTVHERDVWSMNNLGLVHIRQGRFVDALPPLARAVELEPRVAIFQNNLGMALERSGYIGNALAAYRAAVDADPAHEKARRNLARLEAHRVDADIVADLPSFARLFVEEVGRRRALAEARRGVPQW